MVLLLVGLVRLFLSHSFLKLNGTAPFFCKHQARVDCKARETSEADLPAGAGEDGLTTGAAAFAAMGSCLLPTGAGSSPALC